MKTEESAEQEKLYAKMLAQAIVAEKAEPCHWPKRKGKPLHARSVEASDSDVGEEKAKNLKL